MSQHHNKTAEQQGASSVFDSLTPQQQSELVQYAESLLADSADFNGKVRQRALAGISDAHGGVPDVAKLTDDILPFAMAKMPDGVRHALIQRLREMLLEQQ